MTKFDVVIIGSGPAGVSAAFPLVKAGLNVLMVDGGNSPNQAPPQDNYLSWRGSDSRQFERMIGDDLYALKKIDSASPKLRVPSMGYVFEGFHHVNKIINSDFLGFGSLASGGLSNAWGCGVAALGDSDLMDYPFSLADLKSSYEEVALRIGISGGIGGDLSEYYGLDEWAQPAIEMDQKHRDIFARYSESPERFHELGFRLDRPRMAILSEDHGERQGCNLSGNCLWGCSRKSLYSSFDELPFLVRFANFNLRHGFLVDNLCRLEDGSWSIQGLCTKANQLEEISCSKVFLAAGTLASTRLALKALDFNDPVRVLSCPTAAFMIWLPKFLGHKNSRPSFGSSQLAFTLAIDEGIGAYGATFSTIGIPMSEFIPHLPIPTRYGIDFLQTFLNSCVIGNLFLPGKYGAGIAHLNANRELTLTNVRHEEVGALLERVKKIVGRGFRQAGGFLVPRSFTVGRPGGDIHYSGTLPMKKDPKINETNSYGELEFLGGVYVVDGSCLPSLSEKPHTFTIMANADRIAKKVASTLLEK